MRVSWLIPVRNGAPWLGAAVRSAVAQLGPDDEVVVVDDGSVDAPNRVLPDDPRIRLLRQPPLGIVAALERGRAACRGALIARLDADDVALPGRIDAQIALLAARPRVVAVGGRARIHRDGAPVPGGMVRYVDWVNGLTDPTAQRLVESPLFHPATTFRASAVQRVGGYQDDGLPEDYDLWLRLVAAGGQLANLPQPVLSIRDRPERLTRTDPRYSRAAFLRAKQRHLIATTLASPRRVAVWGAGKTGRRWRRWLTHSGHRVWGVDVRPRPGWADPVSLASEPIDVLLAAVGVPGARALIRDRVRALRPDWDEGSHWLCVA